MKVVITGVTGFIGGEVLRQCIQDPSITQIVTLSRSKLPEERAGSPKVNSLVVKDFASLSTEVLDSIRDADACIWALGKAWMQADDFAKAVHVDYPLATARAMIEQRQEGNPVRFILVSGGATERDQSKSLWFLGPYRKLRGQAETEFLAFSKEHADKMRGFVMRPGVVFQQGVNLQSAMSGVIPSIKVDVLAKAMVKVAVEGGQKDTYQNADLKAM